MLAQTAKDLHQHYTQLPEQHVEELTETEHLIFKLKGYFNLAFHHLILLLLAGHSIIGLFEASYFMLVEFPEIEEAFATQQISAAELNETVAAVIIALVSTSIMIMLAIRLSVVRKRIAHYIDLIAASILLLINPYLTEYAASLNLLDIASFLQ